MTRFLNITALLVCLSAPAKAGELHEDVLIKVNGMVCDFCAQSIWKIFKDYGGVSNIDVDLDTGIVTVHMKPSHTLSEEQLNKAITYAGYDLVSIDRTQSDHI